MGGVELVQEEVAVPVGFGSGGGGCVEVHDLEVRGFVGGPGGEAGVVGIAGAGEIGPVGGHLV